MKKIQLFLFILLFSLKLSSQVIYVSTIQDELYKLDINTCTYEFLTDVNQQIFDITFHPNGNLYGVSGAGRFFQIDTTNGFTNEIYDFDGQNFNSLTASGDGLIWTTGNKGLLWSYDLINDIATDHGDFGFKATGDLTFFEGNLYAAVSGDRIALIDIENPENSSIVIDQPVNGDIFGIVSYIEDCSDVKFYAITNGDSDIYEIDFETKTLNFICELQIEIGGGASTVEFISSSPIVFQSVSIINPICNINNGELSVEVTGGVGQLDYSLDGTNYQTDNVFKDLDGGEYTVYIRDANGCILTEIVDLPPANAPVITELFVSNSTCDNANGSITVLTSGGTGSLEFSIDGITFQDNNVFTNLSKNIYTITIQDDLNCTFTDSVEIVDFGNVIINLSELRNTSCDEINGFIEVEVNGGASPYGFSIDGTSFQTENSFVDLAAGDYSIIVRDVIGCRDSIFLTIEPSELPSVESIQTVPAKCGESNGSIKIEPFEGDEDLEFSLDGVDFLDIADFINLAPGSYTLFIKDDNDCTSIRNIDLEGSEQLTVANIDINPTDCGESNGSFLLDIQGGKGQRDVIVNSESFQSNFFYENLISGVYEIEIIDEEECQLDTTVIIRQANCPVYIPNVFSPNEDGVNDQFSIFPHPDFAGEFRTFKVLDRWGSLIYNIQNFEYEDLKWDGTSNGKDLSTGVYVYFLEYIAEDGRVVIRNGDVSILR